MDSDSQPPASSRKTAGSWTAPVTAFCAGMVLMHWIYGGWDSLVASEVGVPGNDSFYHIKMAEALPRVGWLREFPWLRFSYFTPEGQAFVSHHVGFHALLCPFVHLGRWLTGDDLVGARWAMAVFLGLNFLLIERLLAALGIRWRGLWWALILVVPGQFFMRHAYVRAIGPSLGFMFLLCWSLLRGRFWTMLLIQTAYVWLYLGGVIFGPLLTVTWVAAHLLADPPEIWRTLRPVAGGLAGWLLGVLFHPYAFGIVDFLRLQVLGSGLSPDIEVGQEWKPYEGVWWFALATGPALVTWILALILRLRTGHRASVEVMFFLLVHLILLVLTLKARRFIEYWPPFALLSAATLAQPVMDRAVEQWRRRLASWEWFRSERRRRLAAGLMTTMLTAVVLFAGQIQWRDVRRSARCKYDLAAIREVMKELTARSEPGDVVFTDDWDVFPVYFHLNDRNHYIVGLDPKFTHERRPDLWARFVRITRGQIPGDEKVELIDPDGRTGEDTIHITLEDIRDHFDARWVITDSDHQALAERLARASNFAQLVYPPGPYAEVRDRPYLLFAVAGAGE